MRIVKQSSTVHGVLLIMIMLVFVLSGTSGAVEVNFLVGDVNLSRDGKTTVLKMDSALRSGDVVATGKKSLCTLKYNDGSNVEIRAESKIMVGNPNTPNSDFVSLISGVVHGKFKKMQKGQGNKVYTPTAVCAIRGTEFIIASSESGESRIELEEGKLQVRNPFGKVNINENENTDIGIAAMPRKDRKTRAVDSWLDEKDRALEENPEAAGDNYGKYMGTLNNNSSSANKKISDLDKNLLRNSMKGKGTLEKANSELDGLEENLEDEMYLNNAARMSLDGIISGIGQEKAGLVQKFLQVKEEANKVADQQRRNHEALQAVKEAYRKAYEDIVKKHRDSLESIKQGVMSQ